MEGVSPEALRAAQREAAEASRKLAAAELELAAARDSLEVYARAASGGGGAARARLGASPDEGKSEAEVRTELAATREVLALEAAEREKVRGRGRAHGSTAATWT
jgi:hypothetical protein